MKNGIKQRKYTDGLGGVTYMSGRDKFRAYYYTGELTKSGLKQTKTIGFYKIRMEADEALRDYKNLNYDIEAKKMTLEKFYAYFIEQNHCYLRKSVTKSLKNGYNKCKALYNMKFVDITALHVENLVIKTMEPSYASQMRVRSLFYHLENFAEKIKISQYYKPISRFINIVPNTFKKRPNKCFSDGEIQQFWETYDTTNNSDVLMVLIMIYTGFRKSEFLNLKSENVNLSKEWIIGGITEIKNDISYGKTKASIGGEGGNGRKVPIHKDILPLLVEQLRYAAEINSEYLFSNCGNKIGEAIFKKKWDNAMQLAEIATYHTPHNVRDTLITRLSILGVESHIIKEIVGHEQEDTVNKHYREFSEWELLKEINRIDCWRHKN